MDFILFNNCTPTCSWMHLTHNSWDETPMRYLQRWVHQIKPHTNVNVRFGMRRIWTNSCKNVHRSVLGSWNLKIESANGNGNSKCSHPNVKQTFDQKNKGFEVFGEKIEINSEVHSVMCVCVYICICSHPFVFPHLLFPLSRFQLSTPSKLTQTQGINYALNLRCCVREYWF